MREKEYSEWMSKQGFDLLRHANCCKIAFNGGWESRQTEVDELQKRVDSISEVLEELQEQADVIRKRGQKFRDSNFLASADMMDICIKEIEQALKGGEE